jgi:hypothetical protein
MFRGFASLSARTYLTGILQLAIASGTAQSAGTLTTILTSALEVALHLTLPIILPGDACSSVRLDRTFSDRS